MKDYFYQIQGSENEIQKKYRDGDERPYGSRNAGRMRFQWKQQYIRRIRMQP